MTEPGPGDHPSESNPRAKLTAAQVIEIRSRYAAGGIPMETLAGEYGVGRSTIQKIVRGQRWRELPIPIPKQRPEIRWTDRENAWLVAHAGDQIGSQAKHFRGRRSRHALEVQRSRLGLSRQS